ncbi:MAG: ShlB/FhaC/HecB family hemolysin secretion/activation protein [Burkholderiales bacterium]
MRTAFLYLAMLLAAAPFPVCPQDNRPPAAAEQPKFDILEFVIEGNSVLPVIAVERAVMPYLGERKTIDDVERARSALEKAYQAAGFLTVVVDIPEQKVDNGMVRLRATEGRVERLRITGSRYYTLGGIRSKVPELAKDSIPNFPEVQRQLAQLNRSEDRRVTPILKSGKTPGTVEIDLKVEDRLPFHGELELNNRSSANTKSLRAAGSVRYDNLWQRDHSVGVAYQTTPQKLSEVQVLSGTYVVPNVHDDHLLALYGVKSNSDLAAIGALNVVGRGRIYGARYIIPMQGSDTLVRSFTLGIDHKRFDDTVNLTEAGGFSTPITYTPMVAQISQTLREKQATTQFGATATFAPRGIFGNSDDEFQAKRARALSNFLAVKAELSRQQTVAGPFRVYAKVDGQLASGALISNEQFVAGGAETVRGYREAEQIGDDGVHGTLELRYVLAEAAREARLNDFHVHAFVDAAASRVREPLPEERSHAQLASTGLGFRLRAYRGVRLQADAAYVLRATTFTKSGDIRVGFRLAYEF